jgi:hypothetical protein
LCPYDARSKRTKTAARATVFVFGRSSLRQRLELIVPVVVVTYTVSPTFCPWLSLTLMVHVPAATEVTVNVALGPAPAVLKVTIPVHEGVPFAAVSGPV